jgi:acyl-[acyl-carrier-protein] desaturase
LLGANRDHVFQLYRDYLKTAESKRRWSVFSDIPWRALSATKVTESNAQRIEIFCAEEMYVPDYSSNGLELTRSDFGMAWFQNCWAFEESKHGLVFREYLTRSGLRSESEFEALERDVFSRTWTLPFETSRQMACYGALQEGATYSAYTAQRKQAQEAGDELLEAIFFYVGRDEAAHGGFYRALAELELQADRAGTIRDLAYVVSQFKMPGDGLIPNYTERLASSGAGISARVFLEHVVRPLLTTLGISRAELRSAQTVCPAAAAQSAPLRSAQ